MPSRLLGTAALLAAVLAVPLPARADEPAKCAGMQQRVYPVAELVIPLPGAADGPAKGDKPAKTLENQLIKLIECTVASDSWAPMGGSGTIDYYPMTFTLVVNQTPEVQAQVADLLAALRRLQDVQVALEVRFLTVPEGFLERLGVAANDRPPGLGAGRMGVDFNLTTNPSVARCEVIPGACGKEAKAADGPTFLSERQVYQLLEAVQGEQRSCVMQAPKVTILNGQAATVNVTDKQAFVTSAEVVQRDGQPVVVPKSEDVVTGFRMSALPVVSADRRFVQLNLKIDQSDLASAAVPLFPVVVPVKNDEGQAVPFTQFIQQPKVNTLRIDKTLTIPDGGTVLLGGLRKVREVVRTEYGPPVLSRVPYVNRLFKNVGYGTESQMVYVLVTPRVLIEEEEQEQPRPTAVIPPPAPRPAKALAELLKAYDEACAAGHTAEAAKLAQAALILDPTCFAPRRGR